jgi:hypothetical protein
MVSSEQSRTELIPLSLRRRADIISDITESIDEITVGSRAVSVPLKRAYSARATLVQETIVWCPSAIQQGNHSIVGVFTQPGPNSDISTYAILIIGW